MEMSGGNLVEGWTRRTIEKKSRMYLHDEALVVASARLRDELILEATSLLIELHHRVLPVLR